MLVCITRGNIDSITLRVHVYPCGMSLEGRCEGSCSNYRTVIVTGSCGKGQTHTRPSLTIVKCITSFDRAIGQYLYS